jgi:putative endonuclease
MAKHPCVYIMANERNGTIYVGVTASIQHRAWQHRTGFSKGFTKRYGLKVLVYFEFLESMPQAISREKQLKSWSRKRKLELIKGLNPDWEDLFDRLF